MSSAAVVIGALRDNNVVSKKVLNYNHLKFMQLDIYAAEFMSILDLCIFRSVLLL